MTNSPLPAPRSGLRRRAAEDANLRGILAIIGSTALFVINDTMVKLIAVHVPAGQIMAIRGAFAAVFTAALLVFVLRAPAATGFRHPRALLRGAFEAVSAALIISALARLPLANVTAILQTVPLLVTVLAVLVYGQRIGWRRSLAVLGGFAGALLVVRPDAEGFSAASLLALGAAFTVAIRDLLTRGIDPKVPTLSITLVTMTATVLLGLALAPSETWVVPAAVHIAMLAATAVVMTGANVLIITAFRAGDIAVIAPFRYTVIIWAVLLGLLVWGDVPEPAAGLGIALIALSGAYALRRESLVAKRTARET